MISDTHYPTCIHWRASTIEHCPIVCDRKFEKLYITKYSVRGYRGEEVRYTSSTLSPRVVTCFWCLSRALVEVIKRWSSEEFGGAVVEAYRLLELGG